MHCRGDKNHTVPDDWEWIEHPPPASGSKLMTVYYKKINGLAYWYSQLSNKWVFDN